VTGPLAGLVSTHRYDQRGCGRSSLNDDYRMDRFVADLEELREHFGYERWAVFGHSFGGTLGLAYASAHPGRVTALVYCNGVGLDCPRHRGRLPCSGGQPPQRGPASPPRRARSPSAVLGRGSRVASPVLGAGLRRPGAGRDFGPMGR
jgi:pimeloyl-ACP methyl ester carboxylesterase